MKGRPGWISSQKKKKKRGKSGIEQAGIKNKILKVLLKIVQTCPLTTMKLFLLHNHQFKPSHGLQLKPLSSSQGEKEGLASQNTYF